MTEKIVETKLCKQCGVSFDITDRDIEFYDKVSPVFVGKKYAIPIPTCCPDCRQQRRLSFRNERNLYKRKCDLTGKDIVSMYSPDKPFKIYEQSTWWSDGWNPMDYAKDFDFSKSLFEQFEELIYNTPKSNILNRDSQNSEYTNNCFSNKNTYLLIESSNNEDSYYSYWLQQSQSCMDCSFVNNSNNCYETIDSNNCSNVYYSDNCFECVDSLMISDCVGCSNCIGCIGLRGKRFFVLGKYVGEKGFLEISNEIKNSPEALTKLKQKFLLAKKGSINKYANITNSMNCSGDNIINSNNCTYCFGVNDVKDCKYGVNIIFNSGDCYDVDTVGLNSFLIYESINTAVNATQDSFCIRCWTCNNVYYSENCDNSSNLFGCTGLRNAQFCILNKQYTKEEYELVIPKIIEHMEKNGERGEFFPSSLSPFGYNETVASEFYPLSKEEAIEKGFNRCDYEMPFPQVSKMITSHEIPDIKFVNDDILTRAIECEVTKKPFRIIKPELDFYRKHNIQIPHKHPDQRHKERMLLRNPRKLRDRTCMKCGIDITTTYAPERSEIIYCEDCYHKEIYG